MNKKNVIKADVKERLKISNKKGQSKNSKLWSVIKAKLTTALEAQAPYSQRWLINLAFFAGKQHCWFDTGRNSLFHLPAVKNKVRLVDNQILPKVRRQVSNAIRTNPVVTVVPNTNDNEDIKAAKIGTKVIKHFWRTNKMSKKVRLANTWRFCTGNVFLDDRWNSRLGPTEIDERGNLVYQGDADCGVWSSFEIGVPAVVMCDDDINQFPWLIKMKWRSLEWIDNNYPEGDQVVAEQMSSRLQQATSIFGLTSGSSVANIKGALVVELYIQPCREYPNGLFVTGANGIILQPSSDYKFNHYGIEHIKDIEVPGVFWGMATMEAAVALQMSWNRTISSIDTYNGKMALGKGLVPRGADLDALPDDTHGEWLEYTPVLGLKPEHMSSGTLPRTYEVLLGIIKNSLSDLFSQHEVTSGTNASDIRSGYMVSLLLEQDSAGMVPSHATFEEGLENVMQRILKRIQKGYEEERILKVGGKEGEYDIFAFKGTDLRNNTDVTVKRESSLPDSRLARNAAIMERFERGLYGDPANPEVRRHVMNLMEDAIVEDIYSADRLDEANAQFENELFGKYADKILPNEFDNHFIHSQSHTRYLKSKDIQKLKYDSPEEYQVIYLAAKEHLQFHERFIMESMERAKEVEKEK